MFLIVSWRGQERDTWTEFWTIDWTIRYHQWKIEKWDNEYYPIMSGTMIDLRTMNIILALVSQWIWYDYKTDPRKLRVQKKMYDKQWNCTVSSPKCSSGKDVEWVLRRIAYCIKEWGLFPCTVMKWFLGYIMRKKLRKTCMLPFI